MHLFGGEVPRRDGAVTIKRSGGIRDHNGVKAQVGGHPRRSGHTVIGHQPREHHGALIAGAQPLFQIRSDKGAVFRLL